MIDTIEIGRHTEGTVALNMRESNNFHIAITGRSGAGKSVVGQKIIRNIAASGTVPIIAFDMHHLLSDKHIFPDYRDDIKAMSNDMDAYASGIPIPLFTPLTYPDGSTEELLDITMSIADVLSNAVKLGSRQRECLFKAVDYVAERNLYAEQGIAALEQALKLFHDERSAAIQDKLRYVLRKNLFRDGENFIEDKKINILRLSKFPEPVQLLVVEIVLMYIWRLANTEAFMENGLCLFLDECQNLNWGTTGIIRTILAEGRKLGLQLILITQTLGGNSKSDMTRCLLQAGNQLYFSPPENEVLQVARLLGLNRNDRWQERLRTLGVGRCVVNGSLTVNNAAYHRALEIQI